MKFIFSVLFLLSGSAGLAQTIFDTADSLFNLRQDSPENIQAAYDEYDRLIPNLEPDGLHHAVTRIGLLSLYDGLYITSESNRQAQFRIWTECKDAASRLAPYQEDYRDQLTYFQMSCSSSWMKYASLPERLAELPRIKENFNFVINEDLEIKPALGIDTRFDGGGLYRVLASVYSNNLSSLIRDDLPNLDKALEMIDRAIASRPYPGSAFWGFDFYRNYRIKATVLVKQNRIEEARTILYDAIDEIEMLIEDDELPEGIEPETLSELKSLETYLNEI